MVWKRKKNGSNAVWNEMRWNFPTWTKQIKGNKTEIVLRKYREERLCFFNWIFLHLVTDHILGRSLEFVFQIQFEQPIRWNLRFNRKKKWKLASMQIVLLSEKKRWIGFQVTQSQKNCSFSFCIRHLPQQRLVSSTQIHSGNFPFGLRMMVIKSLLEIVIWSACLHARLLALIRLSVARKRCQLLNAWRARNPFIQTTNLTIGMQLDRNKLDKLLVIMYSKRMLCLVSLTEFGAFCK